MATITKRDNAYHIMVSCGYDVKFRQIRKCMTWNPEPSMTPRQVEKAVHEAAVLFENKVRHGQILEGNITFADFAERWLREYGEAQLAPKTLARYRQLLVRIIPAIGHIRLDKLQPIHLIELYNHLAEDGSRTSKSWVVRPALLDQYKSLNPKLTLFAKSAKMGTATLQSVLDGQPASQYIAVRLCDALGMTMTRGFKEQQGRTMLAKRTVRHHHSLISSILTTAVAWQVIPDNPARRIRAPRAPRLEAKFLDELQTAHLLECLQNEPIKHQTMVKLLLYSGMRRGELCGLEWGDINWEKCLIKICRSSQYLAGKGIFTKDTKTETSDRTIKLPPAAFDMLKSYKAWQNEEKLKLGHNWQNSQRLFTTFDGDPIHPDSISWWFSKFVKKYALPPVSVHSLRHTNITLLIAAGVPLRTVAKRAGHSSTVTTSLIYSHAIQSADEMASEVIGNILKGSSTEIMAERATT